VKLFFWVYTIATLLLALGLPIFSYLTLIYRELGRMTTGRIHEHLEIFEAEIEPKLKSTGAVGDARFAFSGIFGWRFSFWRRRAAWCTSFRALGNRFLNSLFS